MAIAWDSLQKRYDELSGELSNPSMDVNKRQQLQREFSNLTLLLEKHRQIVALEQSIEQTKKDAAQTADAELAQMFADE